PNGNPFGLDLSGEIYLEAEVAPRVRETFERRYFDATGIQVSPGRPSEYQMQTNKWGAELRIYFNSERLADYLRSRGINIEGARFYRPEYLYRVNNNDIWWNLIEQYGYRLGRNPI
ncbi:MAG: hypothetical protein JRG72_11445, partial [Deltaproteobacteria bacterium]|nr:hypothetical protein [Deltaproteobacteria bacterium]